MHELNRDSRRETRYSRYSRYSRYADVFFQRLSALSYREWYVEDGYEDKAYSIRELSISEGYHYTLSIYLQVHFTILQ